jgi:hypothetical protein
VEEIEAAAASAAASRLRRRSSFMEEKTESIVVRLDCPRRPVWRRIRARNRER